MTSDLDRSDAGLVLVGLDGSNPLAFLAALGTLRTLSHAWPDRDVRMAWVEHSGAWRPMMITDSQPTAEELIEILDAQLQRMIDHPALSLGDNLNVEPLVFRDYARQSVSLADEGKGPGRRTAADFAATFACDIVSNEQGVVQDTAMRTMSGAGHQHFLKSMRDIIVQTTPAHLRKALFAPWTYDDAVAKQSLRWDPADDSRYALQWRDPSGDPSRKKAGAMLGANRLAVEGLPLLTAAPSGGILRTVGFSGASSRDTFWTWPIWSCAISLDVCHGLLALDSLQEGELSDREARLRLCAIGVCAVFRSQRITVGKFRNFTPARAV